MSVRVNHGMNHIKQIYDMEQVCFPEKPWSMSGIHAVFNLLGGIWIVEDYGYALGVRLGDECELYRIAVMPQERSKGLGRALLERFLTECNSTVFLEVASRNAPAISLYRKCGFEEIAVRKGYYYHLRDDCIVMKFSPPASGRGTPL